MDHWNYWAALTWRKTTICSWVPSKTGSCTAESLHRLLQCYHYYCCLPLAIKIVLFCLKDIFFWSKIDMSVLFDYDLRSSVSILPTIIDDAWLIADHNISVFQNKKCYKGWRYFFQVFGQFQPHADHYTLRKFRIDWERLTLAWFNSSAIFKGFVNENQIKFHIDLNPKNMTKNKLLHMFKMPFFVFWPWKWYIVHTDLKLQHYYHLLNFVP